MSTTAVDVSTGAISTEKTTIRRYIKFDTVVDGDSTKVVKKETRVVQETAAKDKDTGLPKAWADAEKDGLVLANENTATTYSVKSQEGFELLVPDPDQRMYIVNLGLGNLQTSKIQGFMKADVEGSAEFAPMYNQVDLDLRVGIGEDGDFSINKAPQRRGLSTEERIRKNLTALGIPEEAQEAMILSMLQAMAAQQA